MHDKKPHVTFNHVPTRGKPETAATAKALTFIGTRLLKREQACYPHFRFRCACTQPPSASEVFGCLLCMLAVLTFVRTRSMRQKQGSADHCKKVRAANRLTFLLRAKSQGGCCARLSSSHHAAWGSCSVAVPRGKASAEREMRSLSCARCAKRCVRHRLLDALSPQVIIARQPLGMWLTVGAQLLEVGSQKISCKADVPRILLRMRFSGFAEPSRHPSQQDPCWLSSCFSHDQLRTVRQAPQLLCLAAADAMAEDTPSALGAGSARHNRLLGFFQSSASGARRPLWRSL